MVRARQLRRGFSFLLGLATAGMFGLITPSPTQAIPWGQLIFQGIQLIQLSNLSVEQKAQLGQQIHQQVIRNQRLETDPQANAYVNRIGQRLVAASDCSQVPFRFFVVRNSQINAFSTTGGYVYVNTGTIKAANNEAQLASVIGHEMGHICNDDLVRRLKQSSLAQGAATLAGVDRNVLANLGYKLAVELPHSRQDEFNADAKGLQYITQAGYDPRAIVAFLSKLLNSASPPAFLSDHPATRDRITVLEQKITASGY